MDWECNGVDGAIPAWAVLFNSSTSTRLGLEGVPGIVNKKKFFDSQKKTNPDAFFDKSSNALQMKISKAIVDLVGELFFHPKDDMEDREREPITKANTMKLFELSQDGPSYLVTINNPTRFWLVVPSDFPSHRPTLDLYKERKTCWAKRCRAICPNSCRHQQPPASPQNKTLVNPSV